MRGVLAALTVALALVVGACGGDDKSTSGAGGVKAPEGPKAPTQIGEGEGQVNLIAWAGYVEDGSTDPKVDWVSDFEQQTGCQVDAKVGNTSDEMVTLMRTGQYDGVSASGDATLRLIAAGDVAPVNTDLVKNYAELDDKQFQAAVDLLKTQRGLIGEYWSDYTKEQAAFASGNR